MSSMVITSLVIALYLLCIVENAISAPSSGSGTTREPTLQRLDEYFKTRDEFIVEREDPLLFGANLKLTTDDEKELNKILMNFKRKELEEGLFQGGKYFGAGTHFFHTKPLIEASNVYKIIRALAKGGALHLHETSTGDATFVVKNLTTSDDLYYCPGRDQFKFFSVKPTFPCDTSPYNKTTSWVQLNEMRRNASSDEYFDKWLFGKFSLVTSTPEKSYPDINTVWKTFENTVNSVGGIVKNVEARRHYFTHILQSLYDDNIMYAEFRSGLSSIYKRDGGEKLSSEDVIKETLDIVNKFKSTHPDFWGVKYIFTTHRFQSPEAIEKSIEKTKDLMKKYPDVVVGFDLVGQEDKGNPLKTYVPQLLHAADSGVKFFFHAGETDWKGSKIDDNLLDAVMLNSSRFGHAFSLPGRPELMELVKSRMIATEVCPISNQILGLVEDFRNHPASQLFRAGFPVVVSSDDPGAWGAYPLSHDWYITFMALANEREDLRFLKQLAINSIELSAMSPAEKKVALDKWNEDWNDAVTGILDWLCNSNEKDLPLLKRL